MNYLLIALSPILIFSQAVDFSEFDRVLKTYVNARGFVNYQGILDNEKATIESLAGKIAKISPKNRPELFKSRNEKLSYWMNTYNLLIIKKIIDNYPTESIKDIYFVGALVWSKGHDVGEDRLSFNNIEHDIIRKEFNEPRIHFGINCASFGCPVLQNSIFTPDKLEEQLVHAMSDFYKSERHFNISDSEKKIYLTAIFDWFKEDFYDESKDETIFTFLIRNATSKEIKAKLESIKSYKIVYPDYSWDLNKQ
jgi:hypothetical protein